MLIADKGWTANEKTCKIRHILPAANWVLLADHTISVDDLPIRSGLSHPKFVLQPYCFKAAEGMLWHRIGKVLEHCFIMPYSSRKAIGTPRKIREWLLCNQNLPSLIQWWSAQSHAKAPRSGHCLSLPLVGWSKCSQGSNFKYSCVTFIR